MSFLDCQPTIPSIHSFCKYVPGAHGVSRWMFDPRDITVSRCCLSPLPGGRVELDLVLKAYDIQDDVGAEG